MVMPALQEPYHQGVVGSTLAQILAQRMLGPDGRPRAMDFSEYGAAWNPIATGTVVTQNINIQSDSDFLAFSGVITVRANAAGFALDANQPLLVRVEQGGSGRFYTNIVQDVRNMFGTAQDPMWYAAPLVMSAGSTIAVTLENIGAADLVVRVGFSGVKVFASDMGL